MTPTYSQTALSIGVGCAESCPLMPQNVTANLTAFGTNVPEYSWMHTNMKYKGKGTEKHFEVLLSAIER